MVQERNPHNYESDFAAELPLYRKSKAFASLVVDKYVKKKNQNFLEDFPKSIEELWIDLYERGFVEIEDVRLVKVKFISIKNKMNITPTIKNTNKITAQCLETLEMKNKTFVNKYSIRPNLRDPLLYFFQT